MSDISYTLPLHEQGGGGRLYRGPPMAQRRGLRSPPSSYLAEGGRWPDGPFPDATPAPVLYAAGISRLLAEALRGRRIGEVAEDADVHRSTVSDILAGSTWPDLATVAKLEQALGARLWPDRL